MANEYNLVDWAQRNFFAPSPSTQRARLAQNLLGSVVPERRTANDTINDATMAGADREAQSQQRLAQTQGIMNNIQNDIQKTRTVQGLLGASDMAQLQNSALLDRFSNVLDGTKAKYAEAQAAGDQQGMDDAHAQADIIRNGAKQMGLDVDAYAADKTRAQVEGYNQLRHLKDFQALMNMPTSGEYYDQLYQKAIGAGMSKEGAKDYAGTRAMNYQAQRLASLNTALYYGGGLKDGAINNNGAYIMQMMRDENPDSIALTNAYYAKPINEYTFMRGEQAKDRAMARTQNNAAFTENLQEKYSDKQTSNKIDIINATGAVDIQKILANGKVQRETAQALQEAKINGAKSLADYASYLVGHLPKDQAQAGLMALFGGSSGGSKASSGGGSSSGSSASGGAKQPSVSDNISIIKLATDWDENHPGEEWANPYINAKDNAVDRLNGYGNYDPDNYNSVSSAAQDVLEEAARRGKPYSAVQLGQMIANMGGYGPQIAQEWMDKGYLLEYSNGKWE